MNQSPENSSSDALDGEELALELSDEDILEAMREIPGFLDISTEDFRAIYGLAHRHALERMFFWVRARDLMLRGVEALRPDLPLDQAARVLASQRRKGLPVVDDRGVVVGMLTESDFLERLGAESFLELLLRLLENPGGLTHRCHLTPVSAAMTPSPVSVLEDAGFRAILEAFRAHDGRSMPVVDRAGRLVGLLLRKDFIKGHHLEGLL